MSADPLGIGLIGCGKISETYVDTLGGRDEVRILRCADLDAERAQVVAHAAGAAPSTTAEVLADDRIQLVLNLTPPSAHAEVALAALAAGKHVYGEKPLAALAITARGSHRAPNTPAAMISTITSPSHSSIAATESRSRVSPYAST